MPKILENRKMSAHSAYNFFARMAELADAVDSKSTDGNIVRVRPPLRVFFSIRIFLRFLGNLNDIFSRV